MANPLRSTLDALTDESLHTATLVGLASVPVTLAVSMEVPLGAVSLVAALEHLSIDTALRSVSFAAAPNHISLEPLFLAGVLVGVLYRGRETGFGRAGKRTGLVGSLPFLWQAAGLFQFVWSGSFGNLYLGTGIALLFTVVGVVFVVVVAMIGARVGHWLAGSVAWSRSTDADA